MKAVCIVAGPLSEWAGPFTWLNYGQIGSQLVSDTGVATDGLRLEGRVALKTSAQCGLEI